MESSEPIKHQDVDASQINDDQDQEQNLFNYDIQKLNLQHLERKQAFQAGQIFPKDEFVVKNGKQTKDRVSFLNVPDVLPCTIPESDLDESNQNAVWIKGRETQYLSEEVKETMIPSMKPIQITTVTYSKPMCIIYNPNSGKKRNMVPLIEQKLKEKKLKYELKPTQKAFDTYMFAHDIDLDLYSVLVVCGGDGSIHEVINGMLARDDGKKIPVAVLPNGTGNDFCASIGLRSFQDALEQLVCGKKTFIDTIQCVVDHESVTDVPKEKRASHVRHLVINGAFSIPCRIANGAIKWKKCCGAAAYTIAALGQFCKCSFANDLYEISIDGKSIYTAEEPLETILIMIHNGKYTGGGMVVDPFAILNDGMLNVSCATNKKNFKMMKLDDTMKKAKKGGLHAYEENNCSFFRGRKMKVTFKGTNKSVEKGITNLGPQLFGVDGEDLRFNNFVNFDTKMHNVEILFDADKYFSQFKSFA